MGVFRLQLFKPSEVFIAQQASHYRKFSPLLIGRELHGPAAPGLDFWVPPKGGTVTRAWRAVTAGARLYDPAFVERRPLLIHAHFGADAVAALPISRRLSVPLVTTFHGFDATTRWLALLRSKSPSLIRYALKRSVLAKQGARFICVSKFIQSKVLELGFPEERTLVHHIGTNVDELAVDASRRDLEPPTVLHVARLVEKKGTADLLSAFKKAVQACPDARLVIIGDGPLKNQLVAQTQALGLDASVSFLGVQPHAVVRDWLAKASVFALPSVTASNGDTEGLPISIIEAAASALPIVATWHSGIPESVEHERGGFLAAEHDVEQLATGLIELLRNADLRRTFGLQAQAFVRAHFDVKQQSVKLEGLYEELL